MVHICYTGDEGYAMQIATSLVSVLESNQETEMTFYILGDSYSVKTKKRFAEISELYGKDIHIIDITGLMKKLEDTVFYQEPDIGKNGLITFMYARLFVDSALPEEVDKVLYIDGDTIILGNVKELYETELDPMCVIGAIRDIWPVSHNEKIGLGKNDLYFISGLLLIDLKRWREDRVEELILSHMHETNFKYLMHDQDVINVCLKGKIDTLPLKWGMTYISRAYKPEQILWFSEKTEETFYTKEEIINSQAQIALIHYTGDYYGRPWVYPMACSDSKIWYRYFKMTPWGQEGLNTLKNFKSDIKYIIKKILEKPIKDIWLKRTHNRFLKIEED